MFNVKSVNEVFSILQDYFSGCVPETEWAALDEAASRVAAQDILSGEYVPGFNRSSVDGYAVIASDTFGASEAMPAQLELAAEVRMGERPSFSLKKGTAAYIPTGGELPEGADAIVMIEYTEELGDGFIYIAKASAPGTHVVFCGDDVKEGEKIIKKGTILKPQHIGALAALGITAVPVRKKLAVGILSTGDEVVPVTEKVTGAKVRDVNSHVLRAGVLGSGCIPRTYGIVGDNPASIREAVEKALQECDILLISGGSSVGTKDATFEVIKSLGQPGILVHGIAVKPGKPTIIGKINNKAVIGLPGHPASAYFIYKIFVTRLIGIMYGIRQQLLNTVQAVTALNYPSNNGREEYLPVRLEQKSGITYAHPIFGKSGLITLLTSADGYIRIHRGTEGLKSGEIVSVILF